MPELDSERFFLHVKNRLTDIINHIESYNSSKKHHTYLINNIIRVFSNLKAVSGFNEQREYAELFLKFEKLFLFLMNEPELRSMKLFLTVRELIRKIYYICGKEDALNELSELEEFFHNPIAFSENYVEEYDVYDRIEESVRIRKYDLFQLFFMYSDIDVLMREADFTRVSEKWDAFSRVLKGVTFTSLSEFAERLDSFLSAKYDNDISLNINECELFLFDYNKYLLDRLLKFLIGIIFEYDGSAALSIFMNTDKRHFIIKISIRGAVNVDEIILRTECMEYHNISNFRDWERFLKGTHIIDSETSHSEIFVQMKRAGLDISAEKSGIDSASLIIRIPENFYVQI